MVQKIQSILRDSKTARWAVLLCLALPMFASYFFDDIFSTVSQIFNDPNLLALGWNSEDYGFYGGAYSLLCVWGGLIICGALLDKWGVRFTGTLFVGLMVAGSLIVVYSLSPMFSDSSVANIIANLGFSKPSLILATAGCAIFGLGSEIAGVAVTKSIAKWFKGKEMALAMGLQLSLARMGTAAAMLIAPMVIARNGKIPLSESNNMAEIGLFLMIIGIATWFVFISFDKRLDKQDAEAAALNNAKKNDDDKFKFSDIGKILTNKNFILIALLCVFFYCCIISFKRFATSILIPRFGLEDDVASSMATLLPVAPIIFTPLFGLLVDYKGRATQWMIIGSFIVLFSHLIVGFAPNIPVFGFISFALLGIGYSLVPAAMWQSVPKIIPENKLGTAYSLIYWVQNVGMWLVPIIIGKILTTPKPKLVWVKLNDGLIGVLKPDNEQLSRVINAELVFIGLACIAIIVSFLLRKSSNNNPELRLDEPNKVKKK
ncbi:MAG: MFS transporter [Prevotellaceae bacterium]|jgi:MFS family permease|nr:MFS transporter [Prevotellaceae bacterium]